MTKVAISTLGCRANQLESSIISDNLKNAGFEVVSFKEVADFYIINSCTVTQNSDKESKYFARQAKHKNPEAKVILTGCYAQVSADEASEVAEIDYVFGNSEKQDIPAFLTSINENEQKIFVSDIMKKDAFDDKRVYSASGRTRAIIKIQDGCNFRCSYCIIPYARGKSRSNIADNVIEQVKAIVDNGFKEVVLSGIHLGQWGMDLKPADSLADLLVKMEEINGLERIRLSSIDPQEFSDELIERLVNSPKICRHLHISLQSGNNEILKSMRRRYSVEYYSELIQSLSAKVPELAIGSDIIVGFPGETDEQFEDTCANLQALPISYIHVFPYSIRKGTPAAEMSAQVPDEVKKYRSTVLKALAAAKAEEFKNQQIGKAYNILVERTRDKKSGMLKGMTDNYLTVLLDGDDSLKNTIVLAELTQVNQNGTLTAKLL